MGHSTYQIGRRNVALVTNKEYLARGKRMTDAALHHVSEIVYAHQRALVVNAGQRQRYASVDGLQEGQEIRGELQDHTLEGAL